MYSGRTEALQQPSGCYRLLPSPTYDPADETWEFLPAQVSDLHIGHAQWRHSTRRDWVLASDSLEPGERVWPLSTQRPPPGCGSSISPRSAYGAIA
jgi:hypothetical protein